jgi:hypothetical protein
LSISPTQGTQLYLARAVGLKDSILSDLWSNKILGGPSALAPGDKDRARAIAQVRWGAPTLSFLSVYLTRLYFTLLYFTLLDLTQNSMCSLDWVCLLHREEDQRLSLSLILSLSLYLSSHSTNCHPITSHQTSTLPLLETETGSSCLD